MLTFGIGVMCNVYCNVELRLSRVIFLVTTPFVAGGYDVMMSCVYLQIRRCSDRWAVERARIGAADELALEHRSDAVQRLGARSWIAAEIGYVGGCLTKGGAAQEGQRYCGHPVLNNHGKYDQVVRELKIECLPSRRTGRLFWTEASSTVSVERCVC